MGRRKMMKRKTVLVTGATSGIGREVTKRFAGEGWNVICHFNTQDEKVGLLAKALKKYGVEAHFKRADFSSEEGIERFLDYIKGFAVDSLINNAGTYIINEHYSKLKLQDLARVFMVNTFAPIMLSSAVFPGMAKRNFGRIVNISSIAAKYGGSPYSMHYGSSKRALEGLTKTLSRDGAACNILVNTVRPGVIDTEFHRRFPKDMSKRIAMIPLKRMGRPESVADIVYYLGSDRNDFVTNEVMAVAGGE